MTTPVTAQQAQVITQSAQAFEDGVNAMNQVYNQVFAAGDQLKGQAMVSTAGAAVQRRHYPMDRRLQQHQGNAPGDARPAALRRPARRQAPTRPMPRSPPRSRARRVLSSGIRAGNDGVTFRKDIRLTMSDGDIFVNYGSVNDVEDVLQDATNAVSRFWTRSIPRSAPWSQAGRVVRRTRIHRSRPSGTPIPRTCSPSSASTPPLSMR